MIYLFGNYRALGELGMIDKEEAGGGDLHFLPPQFLSMHICTVCVCEPEDIYPRGASKG